LDWSQRERERIAVRERIGKRERGLSERERIEMRGDESDGFTMDWSERERRLEGERKDQGGMRERIGAREREHWSEKKWIGASVK
jgi:hypothetical protein